MFKDVFISHAKEDIGIAEQLYDYLSEKGYIPWLDKKKLKVGANWDYEIKKALKNSTFVILLLSPTSVKKRGYFQKEFKYALEYSESKLLDDIYIIPIILDQCEVPEQLSRFQWIEVSQENFREQILVSLNYQRQKYLSTLSPESIELNDYTTISIDLNVDIKNKIEYQCDLPLFNLNTFFDANFVNTFIQQKALEIISNHRKWINEIKEFIEKDEAEWYLNIHFNINYLTKDFLSLSIIHDSFLGGAHPHTGIDTLNFKFKPVTILKLGDIIQYTFLDEFLSVCIKKYGDEEQKESLVLYIEQITEESIDFVFSDTIFELIFINHLPHVIMELGFLKIPLSDLEFKG